MQLNYEEREDDDIDVDDLQLDKDGDGDSDNILDEIQDILFNDNEKINQPSHNQAKTPNQNQKTTSKIDENDKLDTSGAMTNPQQTSKIMNSSANGAQPKAYNEDRSIIVNQRKQQTVQTNLFQQPDAQSTEPMQQGQIQSKYIQRSNINDGMTLNTERSNIMSFAASMKSPKFLANQFAQKIEGNTVYFPFKPYESQTQYMKSVIQAISSGQNALLESPTGTGKTLSLLCSSLAWLQSERNRLAVKGQHETQLPLPKIIYCSRTHSQLAQVQKECKNTVYKPRTVLIASRDHLCVNPNINMNKGAALNAACRAAQRVDESRKCRYFQNKKGTDHMTWQPVDIEELHKLAQQHVFCPYYVNRERVQGSEVDLIFMPYNYLIDRKIREQFKIQYENSVIIFDEAHNIAPCCEDVASFEIKTGQLEAVLKELHDLQETQSKNQNDSKRSWKTEKDQIAKIKLVTELFSKFIKNFDMEEMKNSDQCVQNLSNNRYLPSESVVIQGTQIFNIFFQGTEWKDIDQQGREVRKNLQDQWELLNQSFQNAVDDITEIQFVKTATQLSNWHDVLKKVMDMWNQNSAITFAAQGQQTTSAGLNVEDFYVFLFEEEEKGNQQSVLKQGNRQAFSRASQRVLGFWCFSPGVGFKEVQNLLNPRSIILTSGTLSPLTSFEAELQVPFKTKLEGPHVIQPEQVFIGIMKRGVNGGEFNFSYQNKDNQLMLDELGYTVARISQHVPGGLLIFFPSYWLMNSVYERWDCAGVLDEIEKFKKVFKEPKKATEYQGIMDSYYTTIFDEEQQSSSGSENGAIMMGVCRGRISEGLDFSDRAARCVIIVGIPFPQMTDPKVILKKEFLNLKAIKMRRAAADNGTEQFIGLSGKDWYNQQATRSVNQAIGRVIRHVQDYGSILLFDQRYNYQSNRSQISKWLRDGIRVPDKYDDADLLLRCFYQKMAGRGFMPKVKQLEHLKVEFDDARSNDDEGGGAMPKQINNSKGKNDFFRKRKSYNNQNRENKPGATFGFMEKRGSSEDQEESKDDQGNGDGWKNYGLANRFFQNKRPTNAASEVGQSIVGGQMTITKMVKQNHQSSSSCTKIIKTRVIKKYLPLVCLLYQRIPWKKLLNRIQIHRTKSVVFWTCQCSSRSRNQPKFQQNKLLQNPKLVIIAAQMKAIYLQINLKVLPPMT